ncbi:MAG: O-antigen ligase domain-containing protein [Desulfobulbaceae bacterium]|nr:MAG: O-antigen ligase domain-containing protein [Desulfobulbaceae bacterium]
MNRQALRYIRYIVSGLALGVLSLKVSTLPPKYYLGLMGMVLLLTPFAYIYLLISHEPKTRIVSLLIAIFTFSMAFNLDYNLFYRDYVGVTSVDISLAMLCLICIFAFFVYDARLSYEDSFQFRIYKPIFSALLIYLAICGLSALGSHHLDLSMLELSRLFFLLFLCFMVMNLQDKRYINIILISFSCVLVLESLIGFYQYRTGQTVGLYVFGEKAIRLQDIGFVANRATGTIGDPNIFGYFFEMLIPLMFAMFIAEKRFFFKWWYFFSVCLGCVGIYATLSRGAWMTLPISISLVFLIMFKGRFLRISTFIWIWCASFVFFAILVLSFEVVYNRFTHDDYGSAETRGPLNQAAFSVIEQFPILGVGPNNMAKVFKRLDRTGHTRMFTGKDHVVHNLYLLIWAETGTLGIAAFLWMLAIVIYTAFHHLFKVGYWERAILAGTGAGIVAQGIHGMVDPGFKTMLNMSMIFYTYIGLVAGIAIIHRQDKSIEPIPP